MLVKSSEWCGVQVLLSQAMCSHSIVQLYCGSQPEAVSFTGLDKAVTARFKVLLQVNRNSIPWLHLNMWVGRLVPVFPMAALVSKTVRIFHRD